MTNLFKKIIIFFIIYLLILASVIFLFFMPQISNLKKDRQAFLDKQQELDQGKARLTSLQKINSKKDEFKTTSDTINTYLPDNLEISRFVVQIEGLAKDLGITVDNFSIEEKAATNTKNDSSKDSKDSKNKETGTKFSLSAKAPYPSIISFIKKMEGLARFHSISSINLSVSENGAVDFNTTGYLYYGK